MQIQNRCKIINGIFVIISKFTISLQQKNHVIFVQNNNIDNNMNNISRISPREAYAAYIMGSVLVDVRDAKEVAAKSAEVNHLVSLPFAELDRRYTELPVNRPVVVISAAGIKSREAAKFLAEKGYTSVSSLDGGLEAWEEEGLPIR